MMKNSKWGQIENVKTKEKNRAKTYINRKGDKLYKYAEKESFLLKKTDRRTIKKSGN